MYSRSITACMIVKNEEHCIERCLESMLSHVQQIVICDTGSTDSTPEKIDYWMRGHIHTPGTLLRRPFKNNFSEMRNYTLDAAVCDWILAIDADELITEESWKIIHERLPEFEKQGIDILAFPRHQWLDLEMTTMVGPYPDYQFTMWRNLKTIRYSGIVHEQPTGWTKLHEFNEVHKEHFNRVYLTPEKQHKKNMWYKALGGY